SAWRQPPTRSATAVVACSRSFWTDGVVAAAARPRSASAHCAADRADRRTPRRAAPCRGGLPDRPRLQLVAQVPKGRPHKRGDRLPKWAGWSFHAPQLHHVFRCAIHGSFDFLLQFFARPRQARHHGADGNIEHPGGVGIGQVFYRDQKQHGALVVRKSRELVEDVLVHQFLLLHGVLTEIIFIGIVDGDVLAPACRAAELVDCKVVQDREQPGARVTFAPLSPMADGPLQAVLHQIVRGGAIADQRPRITAQGWDHRFDQAQHVVHGVWTCTASPNLAGSPGAMTRYRRSAGAAFWTICRIGPTAFTMAEPAGLVMKAASGCTDPVPSFLSASAST